MFERRTIFACLLSLNLCILIWQFALQGTGKLEPASTEQHLNTTKHMDLVDEHKASVNYRASHSNSLQRNGNVKPRKNDSRDYSYNSFHTNAVVILTDLKMINTTDDFHVSQSGFSRLIDLDDFRYLLQLPTCSANIEALILVHSATFHQRKRALIRRTWGGSTLKGTPLRLIFLVGAVVDGEVQSALEREHAQYGDLLQGSFIDHYRNMTYKHVMAFKWFLHSCAHAQILIKVDDDVFVNTPQLLAYLENARHFGLSQQVVNQTSFHFDVAQLLFAHPRNLLFCQRTVNSPVKRTYRSKWRVSFLEFSAHYYPPYCPGYAIIYSTDVVARLYTSAQQHTYFWIDDVHITGTLAKNIHIKITTSDEFELSRFKYDRLLSGQSKLNEVAFLFAWHLISPQEIHALWQLHFNLQNTSTPSSNPSAAKKF